MKQTARVTFEDGDGTWVRPSEAFECTGISQSRIERACRSGRLQERREGGRRLVALEDVVAELYGGDIADFRARIERTCEDPACPEPTRRWVRGWREVLVPILDQLLDAETRALVAEAKLKLLSGDSA